MCSSPASTPLPSLVISSSRNRCTHTGLPPRGTSCPLMKAANRPHTHVCLLSKMNEDEPCDSVSTSPPLLSSLSPPPRFPPPTDGAPGFLAVWAELFEEEIQSGDTQQITHQFSMRKR